MQLKGRFKKPGRLARELGRGANLGYDAFALGRNMLSLFTLIYPDSIAQVSPHIYQQAMNLIEHNKMAAGGRTLLEAYLALMIVMTFVRLGYFMKTKNLPPSLPEYPTIASKAAIGLSRAVVKSIRRLWGIVGFSCCAYRNKNMF